jgi:putative chitinase
MLNWIMNLLTGRNKISSKKENKMKINFDYIRRNVGNGRLTQDQVSGIEDILKESEGLDVTWVAYILATAWHETGGKMQPVVESLTYRTPERIREVWPSRFPTLASAIPFVNKPRELANLVYGNRMGNTGPDDGWIYRGRGKVQITGRKNYIDFSRILKLNLEKDPELALRKDVSTKILVHGMVNGVFTGRRLKDYLPGDYVTARRIINHMDSAAKIANIARAFEKALRSV